MTPPAHTAAARGTRRRAVEGHAARAAPASPRIAPRGPRRVSGPAPAPAVRPGSARTPTRGARLLAWLRALPDHRLTDRLVRGRAWIVLVGGLLMGLVAMQVTLLKLNSGIGRAVAQSSNLERRNGELRAAVSRLSAEGRVQAVGAKLGLVAPEAGRVTYLSPRGARDGAAAAQALRSRAAGASSPSSSEAGTTDPPAATSGDTDAQETAATPSAEGPAPAVEGGPAPAAGGGPSQRSALTDQAAPAQDPGGATAGAIAAPGR